MEKALTLDADALILDLEDSVSAEQKAKARTCVTDILGWASRHKPIFVRINPLTSGIAFEDITAVLKGDPDGFVLPKAIGARDVEHLDGLLHQAGSARALILPIAAETPEAIFQLGSYAAVSDRLAGLTWGVEDLAGAVGSTNARDVDGRFTPPYDLARSLTLFGASAAGVAAIETVFTNIADTEGLRQYVAKAKHDGFTGMMAIHPSQLEIINEGFRPGVEELEDARQIVELYDRNPDRGVFLFKGRMIDKPHIVRARRMLENAG